MQLLLTSKKGNAQMRLDTETLVGMVATRNKHTGNWSHFRYPWSGSIQDLDSKWVVTVGDWYALGVLR